MPDPDLEISSRVLAGFGARVLDPFTSARVAGQSGARSTVYLGDRLLVSARTEDSLRGDLDKLAVDGGLRLVPCPVSARRAEEFGALARRSGYARGAGLAHSSLILQPDGGTARAVDAWDVVQGFRAHVAERSAHGRVGLDHLLTATRHTQPTPIDVPPGAGVAYASYGEPGWGGRGPVTWLGPAPDRRQKVAGRRPVVAVLDTGCGEHPWLPDDVVHREPTVDGGPSSAPIGLTGALDDPERSGDIADPLLGYLDDYAGHGTFISGLIRQVCPDADILAVRVMPSEGAVAEHTLLEALRMLCCRQYLAIAGNRPELFVDVVSLSLGYYHEQADDFALDSMLLPALQELGRMGVSVIASAGNNATTRAMYPAAFAPHPGGPVPAAEHDCVPVVSVGASNPDGETVALFSNVGPWVTCVRPGANVVSTFPTGLDGSRQPAVRLDWDGTTRASIDPDDFAGGFGTWSGTSFAAPVLAAEVAAALLDDACGSLLDCDPEAAVERTWTALALASGTARP